MLFDRLNLAHQRGVLRLELLQSLAQRLQFAVALALKDQLRSVQLKAFYMEPAYLSKRNEATVIAFADVLDKRIAERVEDPTDGVRLPEVAFVVIAGDAGVDPVLGRIRAIPRTGLEMIDRQLPAGIYLFCAAVATTELVPGSQSIAVRAAHQDGVRAEALSISTNTSA